MDLKPGLWDYISSQHLFSPGDLILVAVSAGVDSMVLTHLLNKLNYQISIAHANFQLRGDDSEQDEQLLRSISKGLSVPFLTKRFETSSYAKTRGISTQMAARELRYRWFEELCETHQLQWIATAHHLNDVLETLLLNITKGTGIAGLHGILPKTGRLVRPLLFTTKDDIVRYAMKEQLEWREDRSNNSLYYQRNLIRHQVVPVLKKINPDLESSIGSTVEILRSVENLYRDKLSEIEKQLVETDGNHFLISKSKVEGTEPALFRDLIKEYGFNFHQAKNILGESFHHTGARFYSETHVLNVDREHLIISPIGEVSDETIITENTTGVVHLGNESWHLEQIAAAKHHITADVSKASFDLDKLEFPLRIRKWQDGDRFYPLGMENQKKLSDFLIDLKVPRNYKNQVRVVTSGSEVIWVVKHRIDNRYKVTSDTTRVLEISVT